MRTTHEEIRNKTRKEQIGTEGEHSRALLSAPLCFDEQVVWELSQIVVLEVQDLQL